METTSTQNTFYTRSQLIAELERCEACAEKPCKHACPSHCSPADFILAAKNGNNWDLGRAAAQILASNPLGEICGIVCPDSFCMAACSRTNFDVPINIPKVQASIIELARRENSIPPPIKTPANGKKVAIVGAGPAGLSCAVVLANKGYAVEIFDAEEKAGGSCLYIPTERLPRHAIESDISYILSLGDIKIFSKQNIEKPEELLKSGYSAVMVAAGLFKVFSIGAKGDEQAISFADYLKNPSKYATKGKVAVVGGGAVAADCAITAKKMGASHVEMIVRRGVGDMKLTAAERQMLLEKEIDIAPRTRITELIQAADKSLTLKTVKTFAIKDASGKEKVSDIPGTEISLPNYALVVSAIGASFALPKSENLALFYAGDCVHGASTVVEAVAAGKNVATEIDMFVQGIAKATITKNMQQVTSPGSKSPIKSRISINNYQELPVSLATDFFGTTIESPFLLSAAPATDGLAQMQKAYAAGWAGGVMKTAFDNIPIHIPNGYMFTFDKNTYANCDNVSGHALERVCREIEILRKQYPHKLTCGSTGGPVTGNAEFDKKGWQSNTQKLENAGAMAVEYSLSCPQGGDGSEGSIVSQNAQLAAKIIDYVMEISDPNIPKLFKLTAAVTSPQVIIQAVKEVFQKYPHKKAGITLANSFPTLGFRPSNNPNKKWDEGVVVGMSGQGVLPISYLTLASVAHLQVTVSGNGGPMDYMAAANFLALGAKSVQFCSIAMKYGVEVIQELNSGLSHMLAAKNISSINELIGIALPKPITDFMDLTAVKQISQVTPELCVSCGNCTRCGYQAITLNAQKIPVTDAEKCVGCSFCAKMCFAGALTMRERTAAELAALKEH